MATDGMGQIATVERQPRLMVVGWSGTPQPLVLVDPAGSLPLEKPGNGFATHEGWLYGTYKLTPTRVLPAGGRADVEIPFVLMTPVSNIAEVREVREPYRWPAYVFLPVGGSFTLVGASFLAIADKDEDRLAAAAYLLTGIPLVVYGIINAIDSTEYVQMGTPNEGPF
jgi:hypothetical protein